MHTPEQQAAYIADLEAKIEALQAENQQLKVEAERLKKEKGLTREDLKFNPHTGLWSDASGALYCTACLDEDRRNPLKVESHGWRCTAKGHYFSNPDAPHPTARPRSNWVRGY